MNCDCSMKKFFKKDYIGGLYKGDDFVDVGTLKELAERNNMSIANLEWLTNPSAKKRKIAITLDRICRIGEEEL